MGHAQRAIVTGSTSGIGLAVARAPAGEGANVVTNGFGDSIERIRPGIEAEFFARRLFRGRHATAGRSPGWFAGEEACGRVDILVNNAAVHHVSPIEQFPVEKWGRIIAINLSSALRLLRGLPPERGGAGLRAVAGCRR